MTDPTFSASAYDFNAQAAAEHQGLSVKLIGTADMAVRPVLTEFMARVHQAACDEHVTKVVLDFRELAFMNSSCLKGLVGWISSIQDLPVLDRYRVVLISNPELHWQRRSLHALSCLARELITIQS